MLKLHSSMVAYGPAFQAFRHPWQGEVIPAALTLKELEEGILDKLWWL